MTDKQGWVVGIGASAGGLSALEILFDLMPVDSGAAFVIIQHLDPNHESLTAEILARHTLMPTVKALQGMPILPNHVYTIPPNTYLTIKDGVFDLGEAQPRHGLRLPIDAFFASLGEQKKELAIGIILSGTGSDGAVGLKSIKENGGLVLCQSPENAEFDGMPQAAIATQLVDAVCLVNKLPEQLVNFFLHAYVEKPDAITAVAAATKEDVDYRAVLALLHTRHNCDFRNYKHGTVSRRIARRVSLIQMGSMAAYLTYLRENPDELQKLYGDLLINVTAFFRDPDAFSALDELVVQELVKRKGEEEPIRIWIPGCASGEEAYSIAILFKEALNAAGKHCPLQVFATDLDEEAVSVARGARYPERIEAEVPPHLLEKYFEKTDEVYEVKAALRECMTFAKQNVVTDPPFSRLDLISCRNLLIYLSTDVQRDVLGYFHFALNDQGSLFLGHSETVGQQEIVFKPIKKSLRIYRRLPGASHVYPKFPIESSRKRRPEMDALIPARPLDQNRLRDLVNQQLLTKYGPASILVNASNQVLFFSGQTSLYLAQPSGTPAKDALTLIQKELRPGLRATMDRARTDANLIVSETVRAPRGESYVNVCITAHRLVVTGQQDSLLLVTFVERAPPTLVSKKPGTADNAIPSLEDELIQTRRELQNGINGLEAANEELQSANEEIMSVNEELQSTNEEMETSKEELQSMNEELATVNNQLKDKAEQLSILNDDLTNFVSSTGIATLFLDGDSRILRFTPTTKRLFNLVATDVGRYIGDVRPKFDDQSLASDIAHVQETLKTQERVIASQDDTKYLRRIIPYMTGENRVGGVVVTFIDVTERVIDERKLRESESRFRDYANASANRFWATDKEDRLKWVNTGSAQDPAGEGENGLGKTRWQLAGSDVDLDPIWRDHMVTLLAHKPFRDFEYPVSAGNDVVSWWRESGVPVFNDAGGFQGYRGTSNDITGYILLEEKLRRAQRMESIGHLSGGIAHDFNNLLAILLGNIELIEETEAPSEGMRESLDAIKTAVRRGASLTNRLLAFGRVQTLLSLPTNLGTLIFGMEGLMRRALGETVTLSVIHHDPEMIVEVDPNQYENALLNLVINSGAAMPSGGTLTIETSNVHIDQEIKDTNPEAVIGDFVCTSIMDDGVGMSPQVLAEACEPFFTTKAVGEGSGLGLSMVHGFLIQSGGFMTIDSAIDAGTTIKLFLPVSFEAVAKDTKIDPAPHEFARQYRILLVEDNAPVRKLTARLLQSMGLHVDSAADGPTALNHFNAGEKFDLLLTDVVLPQGMSGWAIASQLRDLQPDIGVIICTGYGFESSEKSKLTDIVLLKKPYEKNELATAIHELLDQDVAALDK